MRNCSKCKEYLDLSMFYKNKHQSSGYNYQCKKCQSEYSRLKYELNKDTILERNKQWIESNKEKHQTLNREWAKNNRGKSLAYGAKRKACKINATPSWADLRAIEVEYSLAAWCTKVMGEPYHVDHIVPLQGKTVCGLHVPWNLRVIPARENLSKGNKLIFSGG